MAKKQVCKFMKTLYKEGLIAPYDGNVSFKPKYKNTLYLSPGLVEKHKLKSKMICEIKIIKPHEYLDFDKSNVYNTLFYNDHTYVSLINDIYKPSGELEIHTNLANLLHPLPNEPDDKDIIIIHCHPPNILAYMGLEPDNYHELNTIKTFFPEMPNFIRIAPNVKHIKARTKDLATAILDKMDGYNIIGLENHGIVCVAEDFETGLNIIKTVEFYCSSALKYFNCNNSILN